MNFNFETFSIYFYKKLKKSIKNNMINNLIKCIHLIKIFGFNKH